MNETGATLDVPVGEEQDQNPNAGSTPTAPAPVADFVKWRETQNQPAQSGPDLSSIRVVRPAEEMPDLTSVKKLPLSFDIPNEDHEWVRERSMQRLAENPNDTRAAEALHMQQVVGMLPDDRPPAHDLPDWKPEQHLDLTTGVEPTPLLQNENRDLDRYVEKMRPHAHEKTKEIAERLIAAHRDGHASLPPDYLSHLIDIAYEDSTPQTEVDKALKGMQGANWQGVKESAIGAATTAAKAAVRMMRPGEEDEERDSLGQEVVGNLAGGFAKMGSALINAGIGAGNYARFKTGFYSPEDRKKAIIAGIQMDHDINIAKKTAFPDADETSPVSQVADFTGAMLVPGIGLEGAVTKPLGKIVNKAIEALPANVGKDMILVGKAGKTVAPALAAEELYRRGYNPLYAAAALLGYAPLIQRAKLNIMDRAFGGMSELGNTLAHIPEGVTVVRKIQGDIDKDISYYRGLAQSKREQFEGKFGDVDKTLGDGQRIRTAQLSGPDLEIRELEDQADMLQRRRDSLNWAADLNKMISDGAKIGLTATGLTAITSPALGALSAANALPGEVEQAAKKGTESGLLIGAAGSLPQAIHGFRALRFEQGRDAMMKRGEGKLSPEQLAGLTPEQQQAAQIMAGWHDVMGRTYNPIDRAEAAKLLNIKPEDVPPGWQRDDQTFVVKDRIPSGVAGHELTHHTQEVFGQMLRDKDPGAIKAFEKNYDDLIKKAGIKRQTSIQAERDAEVGRILLIQSPIEMFYGGESGGDVIRRRLSTFLQDRFPNLFDKTQVDPVLGAPYSPSDLREMRARYAKLGEMAAGQPGATSEVRSKASVLNADHQAIADTVTAAVNQQFKVNPNDKANVGRNQTLVSQAILDLQKRGEPITQESVFKEVMTPKPVTQPIAAQPAPQAAAPTQNKIIGPALVDTDGKTILAQGVVGQTHEEIAKAMQGKVPDELEDRIINALGNDAQHVFVDAKGQPHNRSNAADIARGARQVGDDVKELQSQHLGPEKVQPGEFAKEGYTATDGPSPVAEFEKWRQAQQGIEADPLSGLTAQEIAALHRAQERGDIKNDEDLKKWIEQRTAGDRGAKLQAVKQFQESGQPFKVTFTKADGSDRVMNAQFGVSEHPETGEKLVKGKRTKMPDNPAVYTVFDTDKNEYRTFDIDRVKSIEDAQGVKKFMPEGAADQTDTPEFRKWFGGSHVVNDDGRPLTVYKAMHPYDWTQETPDSKGSDLNVIQRTTEFPAFNHGEKGTNIAAWFGDKETANRFTAGSKNSAIFPVFLKIENPYIVDGTGMKAGDIQFGASGKPFRDAMRSGKYDGAIIKNTDDEGTIYATTDANQVKSATGNSGTFDASNPDIRFMPESDRPEKRFSEKIKGPAIRVADIPFTGKTYAEAEKAARDFGFEPNDIKNAERGYVTNKGAWKTPDEASSFAAERGQMGKQAEASPLRTQDFNRHRKFMPEGNDAFNRFKEEINKIQSENYDFDNNKANAIRFATPSTAERYAKSVAAHAGLKPDQIPELMQAARDWAEVTANVLPQEENVRTNKAGKIIPDRFYPDKFHNIIDRLTGQRVDSWEGPDPGEYSMSLPYDSPQEMADHYSQDNQPLPMSWTGPHPDANIPEGIENNPDGTFSLSMTDRSTRGSFPTMEEAEAAMQEPENDLPALPSTERKALPMPKTDGIAIDPEAEPWIQRAQELFNKENQHDSDPENNPSLTKAEGDELDLLQQQGKKEFGSFDKFYRSIGGKPKSARDLFKFMPEGEGKNLVAVHNLTAGNLAKASELGGLAMPSIAITRADKHPFTNFGEISLVGSPELITPSRDMKVGNADAYSVRYPQIKHFLTDESNQAMRDMVGRVVEKIPNADKSFSRWSVGEEIDNRGIVGGLRDDPAMQLAYLNETGAKIPKMTGDQQHDRYEVSKLFYDADAKQKYEQWLSQLPLKANEKIFRGFTNLGNRRYLEHNLDNVIRVMKSEFKEGEGFNYGAGSVRSRTMQRFKTIRDIQKSRDKIISGKDMDKLKDEANDELTALADEIMPMRETPIDGFGRYDAFSSDLMDLAMGGRKNHEYLRGQYGDVWNTAIPKMREYLDKLRDMPSEYFEAKSKRAVQLQEFLGAAVPHDTKPETLDVLKRHGLQVETYQRNDPESRRQAIEKIATEAHGKFMPDSGSDDISVAQPTRTKSKLTPSLGAANQPPRKKKKTQFANRYSAFSEIP